MTRSRALDSLTLKVKRADILIPAHNWRAWQQVFEHHPPETTPLLKNPDTFRAFIDEYSVGRTIRKGTIDKLRETLAEVRTLAFLSDPSGKALDETDIRLRRRFGTMDGRRGLRSLLSKVAAFLKPNTFIAFDKYALVGVRRVRRNMVKELKAQGKAIPAALSGKIDSYSDYLVLMNEILTGPLGVEIKKACVGHYPSNVAAKGSRFHRRVLDIYLSRIGGRQFAQE